MLANSNHRLGIVQPNSTDNALVGPVGGNTVIEVKRLVLTHVFVRTGLDLDSFPCLSNLLVSDYGTACDI